MNDPSHLAGSARVLVVDDDEDIRTNIADILCDMGYEAVIAKDGESALQQVRELDFEVVLLDYKMPGMDGATLYSEIKKLRPSVAAFMVTAFAGSDGAKRATDAGTWEVLRKPVDIRELLAKVKQASQAPLLLIVDDDQAFCQSLWDILNKNHYRVGIAYTESEGIQRINDLRFQIALIDLNLGSGDGRRVIEKICDETSQARMIIVSGQPTDAENLIQEIGSQRIDYLCTKPIDIDQLLERITEMTSRPPSSE